MNTPYPGQISMPGVAPQQAPPFQQGYAPQQTPPPGYVPQQTPPPGYAPQLSGQQQQPVQPPKVQEVKFYKSAFFGFSTAAGRFQRDSHRMLGQGWHIKEVAFLGVNVFLQRIICVVYEK